MSLASLGSLAPLQRTRGSPHFMGEGPVWPPDQGDRLVAGTGESPRGFRPAPSQRHGLSLDQLDWPGDARRADPGRGGGEKRPSLRHQIAGEGVLLTPAPKLEESLIREGHGRISPVSLADERAH